MKKGVTFNSEDEVCTAIHQVFNEKFPNLLPSWFVMENRIVIDDFQIKVTRVKKNEL